MFLKVDILLAVLQRVVYYIVTLWLIWSSVLQPCMRASPSSLQQPLNEPAGVHSAYLCSLTCTNSLFLQAMAEERTAIITIRR